MPPRWTKWKGWEPTRCETRLSFGKGWGTLEVGQGSNEPAVQSNLVGIAAHDEGYIVIGHWYYPGGGGERLVVHGPFVNKNTAVRYAETYRNDSQFWRADRLITGYDYLSGDVVRMGF